MAGSGKKNWNVFLVKDYEKLRPLLRLVSYGCYSVKDICQALGKSQSFVSHWNGYLSNILPEDRARMIAGTGKKQRLQIKGDSYYGADNFLAEVYFLSTLSKTDIFLFLNILRILHQKNRGPGCTKTEIGKMLCDYLPQNMDDEDKCFPMTPKTIDAKLKQLVAYGLIQQKKRDCYCLTEDVLKNLPKKQIQELYFAVAFYKNIAMLEVPGFFFSALLEARYSLTHDTRLPFQLVNFDLRRILDDHTAYALLRAKELGKKVSFHYHEPGSRKRSRVFAHINPEAILFNDLNGSRQQLLDVRGQTYRLENISNIRYEEMPDHPQRFRPKTPRREIRLCFHCETAARADELKRSLSSHLPQVRYFSADGYDFLCTIEGVRDEKKYIPLIRQYLPEVEVLSQEHSRLRQYMRESIEEALKNYGE